MARHPLPTEILERNGAFEHDPQRREARENEPVPTGPLGDPPEYFSDAQRRAWRDLADQVPPGVLTNADRILLEVTCGLIARMRLSARMVDPRDRDDDTERAMPLKAAEFNLLISCLARMGLTPADRSKIAAKKQPGSESDSDIFSRLANTGRGQTSQREQ